MRIISGQFKGKKLLPPKHDIRPTLDKVKQALFTKLQFETPNAVVLDLFCGSGNLGIEAISRGAEKVVFIDNSKKSIELCKANLNKLKEDGQTLFADSLSFLKRTIEKFDIIFLDPPYKTDIGENALKIIAENQLLTDDGVAVFESDRFLDKEIGGLTKTDERKYGYVHLSFYKSIKP